MVMGGSRLVLVVDHGGSRTILSKVVLRRFLLVVVYS